MKPASPGGAGGGRGEGQSPFKFTNTRVGMTGSCPLRGLQPSTRRGKSNLLFVVSNLKMRENRSLFIP